MINSYKTIYDYFQAGDFFFHFPNVISDNNLTHWGWVMHKFVNKITNTDSDNGLLPGRR